MTALLYIVTALIFMCLGTIMAIEPSSLETGLIFAAMGLVFALQVLLVVVLGKLSAAARVFENEDEADEEDAAPAPSVATPAAPAASEVQTDGLMLASLLQEKGRLVDFVMDDVQAYSDAQVGAAARIVHAGCKEVIQKAFAPQPIASSPEQQPITLPADFDRAAYRVTGQIATEGAIKGRLEHKGWQATRCDLPQPTGDLTTAEGYPIAPAQVSN